MLSSTTLPSSSFTPLLSTSISLPSVTHDNQIVSISSTSPFPTLESISTPTHAESITAPSIQSVLPSSLVAAVLSSGSNPHDNTELSSEFQPESLQVVSYLPPMNTHAMQTRSKNGIFKPKAFLSKIGVDIPIDFTQVEPSTYKSALSSSVWCAAMTEELSALHSQGTWSLVPLPPNKNLVGCKWVFKIKRDADGNISRYKARLVAKGFNQE
ncbi:hypothetical protein ACFX1Z_002266 [Malus domestica]